LKIAAMNPAEERMQWFPKGLDSGSIDACNTFAQ
jgi:predicted metalloprotease